MSQARIMTSPCRYFSFLSRRKEDGSEEVVREVCSVFTGMEISEEQRKQAITNARRAKQGKNKSTFIFATSVR